MISFSFSMFATAIIWPLAVAAATGAKDGAEWRFLDGFLQSAGTASDSASLRSSGTCWNPQKARRFSARTTVVDDLSHANKCWIIWYFPTMEQRGKDKAAQKDISTTWGVPFAVAPLCGDPITPGSDKTYPETGSVVFHQLRANPGYKDDAYMIFPVKEGSDRVKDSISMTDFEDHGEVIYPADNIDAIIQALSVKSYPDWDRKKEKQPQVDFAQMVNTYVEKQHQNTIPNPYKYGKGHSVWPDYTGINNFWGYNDNGTWITESPNQ